MGMPMAVLSSMRTCLREYLISADKAARFIKVTACRFRHNVTGGFIPPAKPKGFYGIGTVLAGYAASLKPCMDERARAA